MRVLQVLVTSVALLMSMSLAPVGATDELPSGKISPPAQQSVVPTETIQNKSKATSSESCPITVGEVVASPFYTVPDALLYAEELRGNIDAFLRKTKDDFNDNVWLATEAIGQSAQSAYKGVKGAASSVVQSAVDLKEGVISAKRSAVQKALDIRQGYLDKKEAATQRVRKAQQVVLDNYERAKGYYNFLAERHSRPTELFKAGGLYLTALALDAYFGPSIAAGAEGIFGPVGASAFTTVSSITKAYLSSGIQLAGLRDLKKFMMEVVAGKIEDKDVLSSFSPYGIVLSVTNFYNAVDGILIQPALQASGANFCSVLGAEGSTLCGGAFWLGTLGASLFYNAFSMVMGVASVPLSMAKGAALQCDLAILGYDLARSKLNKFVLLKNMNVKLPAISSFVTGYDAIRTSMQLAMKTSSILMNANKIVPTPSGFLFSWLGGTAPKQTAASGPSK